MGADNEAGEEKDKEEVLEKGEEIGRLWRMEMDEDLMMEKRKRRCRMVEMARRERAKGKKMELSKGAEDGEQEMNLE